MATLEKKLPTSPGEFKNYILEYCKPTIGFDSLFEKYYNMNVRGLISSLESSAFWKEFLTGLNEIDAKYRTDNNNLDLIHSRIDQIKIKDKPVDSVIDKAFRQSIIENKAAFDSTDYNKEFVLPENVFEKLNDIIRTELIVKYLDGIDIVGDYVEKLTKKYSYGLDKKYLSKTEGYYAVHLYISYDAKISDFQGVPQTIRNTCEIQLRTQLQYAVKSILHQYYERDRIEFKNDKADWRWQHDKPRFITNYVGHVLHFLDGIIVKIKKGD